MMKRLSNLGMATKALSWTTLLIGIVIMRATLSFALKPGSFQVSYSGISYLLLLLLATAFAIRNASQKMLGSRFFWAFLAVAFGLWTFNQGLDVFYELGLHVEVPDNSIADLVLFLHVVPLMAAVAMFPHRNVSDDKLNKGILNILFLLVFWGFLFGYVVFPYSLSPATLSTYNTRFDVLYLLENLA